MSGLNTKAPITLQWQHSAAQFSSNSIQSNIHHKELHIAPFRNHHGTSQIISNNPRGPDLHSCHLHSKTPTDSRSISIGHFWRDQSLRHLQNCAPHKIGIEKGDIIGIVDTEDITPIPQMTTASRPFAIKSMNNYPKSRRRPGPEKKLRKDVISEHPRNTEPNTSTPYSGIKPPSAWTNTTWVWPRISPTESTSKTKSPSTGNSLNHPRHTINSLNKLWMNGLNSEWFGRCTLRTTHQYSASPRNKDKGSGLCKTSGNWISIPISTNIPWKR